MDILIICGISQSQNLSALQWRKMTKEKKEKKRNGRLQNSTPKRKSGQVRSTMNNKEKLIKKNV